MEYTFQSRISKYSNGYYIHIPKAIETELSKYHGKKVIVDVRIINQ